MDLNMVLLIKSLFIKRSSGAMVAWSDQCWIQAESASCYVHDVHSQIASITGIISFDFMPHVHIFGGHAGIAWRLTKTGSKRSILATNPRRNFTNQVSSAKILRSSSDFLGALFPGCTRLMLGVESVLSSKWLRRLSGAATSHLGDMPLLIALIYRWRK